MKSQEKQLDMLLQSITSDATLQTTSPKQKNMHTTKPSGAKAKIAYTSKNQPSAKNRRGAVIANQKKKPTASTAKNEPTINKTIVHKPISSQISHLRVKLVQLIHKGKEKLIACGIILRKKMPGYIYPSKEDMLYDQKLLLEKESKLATSKEREENEVIKQAKTP